VSTPAASREAYDVVVVGGGHNGLTAAAYLSRAGLSVLVLERLERTGGAAVSAQAFPGHPVRLSRYSYLVSVMPDALMADLGLDVRLTSRPTASYTPTLRDGYASGLYVERHEADETAASFAALTGGPDEYAAWQAFYAGVGDLARVLGPTFMQPLPSADQVRAGVDDDIWRDVVERPIGEAIERRFRDETVRGVVGTDALIGTFASLHDPSLVQNRCLLYHLVGNGTGEWRVPVGGMGAVTDALARSAAGAGAEVLTGAGVSAVRADGDGAEVTWGGPGDEHTVRASYVLANVAPWVLQVLLGEDPPVEDKPMGAQLKINLLLDRLPRLRSGMDPEKAFAGTFHLNEDLWQVEDAYTQAASGLIPSALPGEVYCHSLTDPSILGDAPAGMHTMTYFGLHAPASLFETDREHRTAMAVDRALASLDQHLAEPIMSVVARDAHGNPCLEAKVPQDVEDDLAMPGGHIFHGDLEWPWAAPRARLDTPAQQWGVQTGLDRVLMCGSGARRGGAVSGLGGHNAAQAVLAMR